MASGLPSEDEKTMVDLQERILAGSQALQRLNAQERMFINRKARTELTLAELSVLPDETRMYKSVGKAYFLSDKPVLVEQSKEVIAAADTDVTSIRTQKGVVEQKMKEAETEFKELLQVRQLAGLRAS